MDDLRRREQLQRELQRATEAFDRELRSLASAWGATLGRFAISTSFSIEGIIAVFVLFNVACFAAGIAFILQSGAIQTLGISLVVGGLFSFGAFMAQWWDHAWQRANNTVDRAFNSGYDDKRYAELQRLAKEISEISDKLQRLPQPPGPGPTERYRKRARNRRGGGAWLNAKAGLIAPHM